MNYRIWHSSESFADFIIDNTILTTRNTTKSILPDSDANKPKLFHKVPDHLKKILYLDAPDIIIEFDGDAVSDYKAFTSAIKSKEVGDKVNLKVNYEKSN